MYVLVLPLKLTSLKKKENIPNNHIQKYHQGTVSPGDTTGEMERAGDEELLPDPEGVLTFKDATISASLEWTSCRMSECWKTITKEPSKEILNQIFTTYILKIRKLFKLDLLRIKSEN